MWHWIGICMTVLSKLSNLANDVASAGWLQDTHTHTRLSRVALECKDRSLAESMAPKARDL